MKTASAVRYARPTVTRPTAAVATVFAGWGPRLGF